MISTERARLARLWLAMHILLAPVAVFVNLRKPGDWSEEWRLIRLTCFDAEWWCVLLLVPYLGGLVAIGTSLFSKHRLVTT